MAVYGARRCGGCTHGAREEHRRAVAAFRARRDRLAAGEGVPDLPDGASRRWVSDELGRQARTVAERGRALGEAWPHAVWRGTLYAVWGAVAVLLVGYVVTAAPDGGGDGGWTGPRTAGLVAAMCMGAVLTGAAHVHRAYGGLLAPLIGEDNRLSTSRAVAAAWALLAVFAALHLTLQGAAGGRVGLAGGARLLTALALVCAVAVAVRKVVTVRILGQRVQKVRAERPRAADLLCDDAGRAGFADAQYVLVSAFAVLFAAARLVRRPGELPYLPWALVALVALSAATYLAAKCAEGVRPVILSVVRAPRPGAPDAPIRTGDDIEIRGAGFVPPGAATPAHLTRTVVRIGPVHVHVPLVPAPGGFTSPTDTTLTVPVPADVPPGWTDVQVVTASGAVTNRVVIDVSA
ncbi:hypothetical protein [Streptomyces sp. CB03238]|uniref:hypothetical protein n=1 Tax=Streptomyces sp. CB03238 TaxID=1907777 RepID=UPI000A11CFDD|nr:hypothetical protein [Streptomyces sp. CB03238]ORT59585.1 hypothetical protein BKD26_11785 [Streptomyces sp. CB03238]